MRKQIYNFAFLVTAGLPSASVAQTALERIEPRLSTGIEQYRVFLTCADPDDRESIVRAWREMIGKTRATLSARYTSLADLAAFDKRTAIESVELPSDTPKEKRDAFCNIENKEWRTKLAKLQFLWKIDDSPMNERKVN